MGMYCSQCEVKSADGAKFCVGCGNAFVPTYQAASAVQDVSALSPRWAGFWLLTLAALIDALLCQIVAVVLVVPLGFALGASMAEESTSTDIEAAAQAMGFLMVAFTAKKQGLHDKIARTIVVKPRASS